MPVSRAIKSDELLGADVLVELAGYVGLLGHAHASGPIAPRSIEHMALDGPCAQTRHPKAGTCGPAMAAAAAAGPDGGSSSRASSFWRDASTSRKSGGVNAWWGDQGPTSQEPEEGGHPHRKVLREAKARDIDWRRASWRTTSGLPALLLYWHHRHVAANPAGGR